MVDADGLVALDVAVRRCIHDYSDDFGDLPMDCAIEICHLTLTVEGHEYEDGDGILALTRLDFAPRPGLAGGNASAPCG